MVFRKVHNMQLQSLLLSGVPCKNVAVFLLSLYHMFVCALTTKVIFLKILQIINFLYTAFACQNMFYCQKVLFKIFYI